MSNAENTNDFHDFMKWFEFSYPGLHEKYANKIIAPIDKKGLQVSKSGIDKSTYNMLYEIQNEYYIRTM